MKVTIELHAGHRAHVTYHDMQNTIARLERAINGFYSIRNPETVAEMGKVTNETRT